MISALAAALLFPGFAVSAADRPAPARVPIALAEPAPLFRGVDEITAPISFLFSLAKRDPGLAAGRLEAVEDVSDRARARAALAAAAALLREGRPPVSAKDLAEQARRLARLSPSLAASGGARAVEALTALAAARSYKEQAGVFDHLKAYGLLDGVYDRALSQKTFLGYTARPQADKRALLSFASGPDVLEIGPGGGANLTHLSRIQAAGAPIRSVVAVESSQRAARALADLVAAGKISADVVHGNAFDLAGSLGGLGPRRFGTILYSGVLHEIYSYCSYEGRRFNLDAVRRVLRDSIALLRPGGRLLLRDCVAPEGALRPQKLTLRGSAIEAFDVFARRFAVRPVPYAVLGDGPRGRGFAVSREDAAEFIYKFTWGQQAFPYELQEHYGFLTRDGWLSLIREAAAEAGTAVRFLALPAGWDQYVQETYLHGRFLPGSDKGYLGPFIDIEELDGTPVRWPDSNMMVVAERTR